MSLRRTVSYDKDSTNPNSTALSASNRRVQRSWPSGASLHATAIRWASPLSSNLRYRLAWGWSCNTPSNPSSAYRRLVRTTVRGDVSSAAATWEALHPSSVLSRIRARLMTRAERCPLRINRSRWSRSSDGNRTAYFS